MQVIDFLAAYGAWSWIVAGLILLALELVVPGGFLVWMGVAGIITGIATMLVPMEWPVQWVLFGALSLIAILIWVRWNRGRQAVGDQPFLNRRAERFIGHEAVLDYPIEGGYGRLALGDTVWRIAGPDLPSGRRVRVVANDGAVLRVEPV